MSKHPRSRNRRTSGRARHTPKRQVAVPRRTKDKPKHYRGPGGCTVVWLRGQFKVQNIGDASTFAPLPPGLATRVQKAIEKGQVDQWVRN